MHKKAASARYQEIRNTWEATNAKGMIGTSPTGSVQAGRTTLRARNFYDIQVRPIHPERGLPSRFRNREVVGEPRSLNRWLTLAICVHTRAWRMDARFRQSMAATP